MAEDVEGYNVDAVRCEDGAALRVTNRICDNVPCAQGVERDNYGHQHVHVDIQFALGRMSSVSPSGHFHGAESQAAEPQPVEPQRLCNCLLRYRAL